LNWINGDYDPEDFVLEQMLSAGTAQYQYDG
jgi:hypothetical protein